MEHFPIYSPFYRPHRQPEEPSKEPSPEEKENPRRVFEERRAHPLLSIAASPSHQELEEWYDTLNTLLFLNNSPLDTQDWDDLRDVLDGIYRYLR